MRVLVADDDPGSLLVVKAAVEQSGHECIAAADGDSAWKMYQQYRPQAVVTDLVMPGLDGLSLCPGNPRRRDGLVHVHRPGHLAGFTGRRPCRARSRGGRLRH